MNGIEGFTGVRFQGQIKNFSFKEQQRILEEICWHYVTFCDVEATEGLAKEQEFIEV